MALENWNIDVVHSTVGFTVRHLMVSKVHGFFTKWNGKLAFDEQNPAASHAEAQIEVALQYPVTTGTPTHPGGYEAELREFYDGAADLEVVEHHGGGEDEDEPLDAEREETRVLELGVDGADEDTAREKTRDNVA